MQSMKCSERILLSKRTKFFYDGGIDMNVSEFYKNGQKVFTPELLQKFDFIEDVETETDLLNYFFEDEFSQCPILAETTEIAVRSANFVLLKNNEYLKAVNDAIHTQFDPLVKSKMKEITKNTGEDTDTTKIGKRKSTSDNQTTPGVSTTISENTFDDTTLRPTTKTSSDGVDVVHTELTTEQLSDDITTRKKGTTTEHERNGFDSIDYETAIKSMYETKQINLYQKILDMVFVDICVPIYEFG